MIDFFIEAGETARQYQDAIGIFILLVILPLFLLVGFARYIIEKVKARRARVAELYGYASTFGPPPGHDLDIIGPGAFRQALGDRMKESPILNERGKKIGTVVEIEETDKGLKVEAKISRRGMKSLLQQTDSMSIGVAPVRTEALENEEDNDSNICHKTRLLRTLKYEIILFYSS